MYQPKIFQETRIDVIHDLIRSHAFGTLITTIDGEICADHLPFILKEKEDKLLAHISRANPLYKKLKNTENIMVIFQGPHHYISPNWYPSKQEHHKEVPTWNYAVVHVRGSLNLTTDPAWLRSLLDDLTDEHEKNEPIPWQVSDAPEDYIAGQLKAIVGLEITIDSFEGKWKMGQNKPENDIKGAVDGLSTIAKDQSLAVANLMNEKKD